MKNGARFQQPEVVVVTGASAGVGRATVREFAKHGARIGLLARGIEGLEAAKKEVEELGGEAIVVPVDVSEASRVQVAADKVEQRFGPIDVWVNNAMVSVMSRFRDMTLAEFRRVTEVTYLGTVNGTMTALKRMLPRDHGSIVQVGSALAYRSIPLQSAYCGAKHAIRGFTDSLRSELIHDGSGVRLTMVQLSAINTPQFDWVKNHMSRKPRPAGRIYQPEVAAQAIYWAAHHRRREIFVGVSASEAILGNKVIPGILDHYLAETAFQGQQTKQLRDPSQGDNLWAPLAGDFGAHGRFDAEARSFSPQLWLSENRRLLGVVGAVAAGIWIGSTIGRKAKG